MAVKLVEQKAEYLVDEKDELKVVQKAALMAD